MSDEQLTVSDFDVGDFMHKLHSPPNGPTDAAIFQVVKTAKGALLVHNPRFGYVEVEDGSHEWRWIEKLNPDDLEPIEKEENKVQLWSRIKNLFAKS